MSVNSAFAQFLSDALSGRSGPWADSSSLDAQEQQLATSPSPEELLRRVRTGTANARFVVAANHELTAELQELLSRDLKGIRARVASNRGITPETEQRLLHDDSLTVLRALAANPAISADSQQHLSFVADETLLTLLATNPSLVLSPALSFRFLKSFERGRELVGDALLGLDVVTLQTFWNDWEGSFEALLEACRSFGPNPR